MQTQLAWPEIRVEEDWKSPIPRSWKLRTPRCGLHISQLKKCQYHNSVECSHRCVKGE